ncbi:hypothetical protein [Effusibacillus consociatus]|uniref:Lipoyl-binding domain-containing protein n=1 Tax=Effusibacillus consociatus TaxID=1117041 RepID=A0ABV9PZJ3_9BACL
MKVEFELISPCHGVVDKVLVEESAYLYEQETLCIIKTETGTVEMSVNFGGYITALNVTEGLVVTPGAVLAHVRQEVAKVSAGSD